jgi:protein-disulfide isomerase
MSTPNQPPTKKERRDAARAARVEAEQAAAASTQRKKRLAIILGSFAAVAVIAVVLIATTSGNDGPGKIDKKTGKLPGSADVAAMVGGIPQSGITLGNPKAKTTVVEFIDPQCPICKAFANEVFPTLVQDYIRPGKIRYELRTLTFIGPDSIEGAKFLNAAGFQNKMFNATELLYLNQGEENSGYMTPSFMATIGNSIPGFNTPKAAADAKTPKATALLGAANALASRYAVNGTPTVLVGKTGGTLAKINASSPTATDEYKSGIDAALKLNGGGSGGT